MIDLIAVLKNRLVTSITEVDFIITASIKETCILSCNNVNKYITYFLKRKTAIIIPGCFVAKNARK